MKRILSAVAAVALVGGAAACAPDPTTARPPARSAAVAPFRGASARIDAKTAATRMPHSWRPGCPVPLERLRLLTLDHWGYDGAAHRGELVVHADHAEAVLRVFRALYDARFPIARLRLVDAYGGDDARSMAANNTSAFNCREVAGRRGVWSQHSYGTAVDVNPVQNPSVAGTRVAPPAGAAYLDRSSPVPGMVRSGDEVVRAFAAVGWRWGGDWRGSKDYQHFSANGR